MFRGLGAPVARQLDGVELLTPDKVYDGAQELDLGGRMVRLRATGRAHSQGDQVVTVPGRGRAVHRRSGRDRAVRDLPVVPAARHGCLGRALDRGAATGWSPTGPEIVVPGHGDIGGPRLLADVRDYLEQLRDETWRRRDSAMDPRSSSRRSGR